MHIILITDGIILWQSLDSIITGPQLFSQVMLASIVDEATVYPEPGEGVGLRPWDSDCLLIFEHCLPDQIDLLLVQYNPPCDRLHQSTPRHSLPDREFCPCDQ